MIFCCIRSESAHGKLYKEAFVVVLLLRQGILCGCFYRRTVASQIAAFVAFVGYYVTLLRIGCAGYRHKQASAIRCTVAGVYVDMHRAQTPGAMVAAGFTQGQNLKSAVAAHKTLIVFGKALGFHALILRPFLWLPKDR